MVVHDRIVEDVASRLRHNFPQDVEKKSFIDRLFENVEFIVAAVSDVVDAAGVKVAQWSRHGRFLLVWPLDFSANKIRQDEIERYARHKHIADLTPVYQICFCSVVLIVRQKSRLFDHLHSQGSCSQGSCSTSGRAYHQEHSEQFLVREKISLVLTLASSVAAVAFSQGITFTNDFSAIDDNNLLLLQRLSIIWLITVFFGIIVGKHYMPGLD